MRTAIVIYDQDFPYEGVRPSEEQLGQLGRVGEIVPPARLAEVLAGNDYASIINLHGRYFPKAAWQAITAHLRKGRGLVSVGSKPLRQPVDGIGGAWSVEREQTAYHRELNIRNIFDFEGEVSHFEANSAFDMRFAFDVFDGGAISEFAVKFSHTRDLPREHGSAGPMDASIHPLVFAVDGEGRRLAAPLVLIENTRGPYAGGRWIFCNQNTSAGFWEKGGAALIAELVAMACRPVVDSTIRPSFASYYPGEQPVLLLQVQLLGEGVIDGMFAIVIEKEGKTLFRSELPLVIDRYAKYITVPMGLSAEEGFYSVEITATLAGERRTYRTGFWGYDRALLSRGSRLEAKGDYFTRGGEVFPVNGMTYMASDVHRKYLFLPNPDVWMKDFAFMKEAGINLVRTGTWTNFRNVMFVDGVAYEEVLRAIDAFILTAKSFDIEVVFNFFAFTPEAWEGVGPYTDPVSIEAQKRYIAAIVSRHAATTNVSWDLINEPSACNPEKVFMGPQPNRDIYELSLWRDWLKEKYHDISVLQEQWNCTSEDFESFGQVTLPLDGDLAVLEERCQLPMPALDRMKSLMSMDYVLFTNYVFDRWACTMADTIRAMAPGQLVAVGQDHATSGRKPHPYFHGRHMDYTSVHTWWQLDDIYWDSIFAKIPGKPALVQETGVMYVEDNNEMARRSEQDVRDLLERKLVYAYGAGTAGAVPWVLNSNIYMDDDNEVHIGMLRADLTEKPEFTAVRGIYGFIDRNKGLFDNVMQEKICVIFPFANSYSNRAYANIATRKCARVLAYNLKQTFFGCGDFDLSQMSSPKLIIYPSPRVIADETWEALLQKARTGVTVLVTGPLSYDSHWAKTNRLAALGMDAQLKSVSREETAVVQGRELRTVFDSQLIGWVDKETVNGKQTSDIYNFEVGRGRLLWCPLPIEMGRDDGAIEENYRLAIAQAGIKREIMLLSGNEPGVFIKKLPFARGSIYLLVSEDGADRTVEFNDQMNACHIRLKLLAGRAAMIAVDADGRIIDSYNANIG